MNLKEKLKQDRESAKQRRRAQIIDCALERFCQDGIETTALADIADTAGVGVATLYRYFSTKENLVVECGLRFWELAGERYDSLRLQPDYQEKSGLRQVEELLKDTEEMFRENRRQFKFLHDLDGFLASHEIEQEKLCAYEAQVMRSSPVLCQAIEKGKADGTIQSRAATEELYYTLTHTLLSLLEKLGGIGPILSGDREVPEERRLSLLRQLLLAGLRQEE